MYSAFLQSQQHYSQFLNWLEATFIFAMIGLDIFIFPTITIFLSYLITHFTSKLFFILKMAAILKLCLAIHYSLNYLKPLILFRLTKFSRFEFPFFDFCLMKLMSFINWLAHIRLLYSSFIIKLLYEIAIFCIYSHSANKFEIVKFSSPLPSVRFFE